MPAPNAINELSSTEPSASGELRSFWRNFAEQLREIRVDLRVLLHLFRLTRMMRNVVMRFLIAQRRIRSLAGFPSRHEREDAGHVGLIGHHEQVEHQSMCSSNDSGTPSGAFMVVASVSGVAGFRLLNTPFDLPDIFEIVVQADAIRRADFRPQRFAS